MRHGKSWNSPDMSALTLVLQLPQTRVKRVKGYMLSTSLLMYGQLGFRTSDFRTIADAKGYDNANCYKFRLVAHRFSELFEIFDLQRDWPRWMSPRWVVLTTALQHLGL